MTADTTTTGPTTTRIDRDAMAVDLERAAGMGMVEGAFQTWDRLEQVLPDTARAD